MIKVFLLVAILADAALGSAQLSQNKLDVKLDGRGSVDLAISSYFPMRDAMDFLRKQYGWNVSYEGPYYPQAQLVDIAVPQWKKDHPGERGFLVPEFTDVHFHFKKPTGAENERVEILSTIAGQFNRLNRPDKYALTHGPEGRAVMVGSVHGRAILESAVVRPETLPRSGGDELRLLVEQCSLHTPRPLTVGTVSYNMLQHMTVPPRKVVTSCRSALLSLTEEAGRDQFYMMLEDPNTETFVVNIASINKTP